MRRDRLVQEAEERLARVLMGDPFPRPFPWVLVSVLTGIAVALIGVIVAVNW